MSSPPLVAVWLSDSSRPGGREVLCHLDLRFPGDQRRRASFCVLPFVYL